MKNDTKNIMKKNSYFSKELNVFFDENRKDRFKGKTDFDISEELRFNIFVNFPNNNLISILNDL
jgi:hypothetical protein